MVFVEVTELSVCGLAPEAFLAANDAAVPFNGLELAAFSWQLSTPWPFACFATRPKNHKASSRFSLPITTNCNMHFLSFLYPALLVAGSAEALRSGSKVKLSNVQSLTLRKDLKTSHRRVSAIPQVCSTFRPQSLGCANLCDSSNASAAPHEVTTILM